MSPITGCCVSYILTRKSRGHITGAQPITSCLYTCCLKERNRFLLSEKCIEGRESWKEEDKAGTNGNGGKEKGKEDAVQDLRAIMLRGCCCLDIQL